MSANGIYINIELAREEVQRRWHEHSIKKKVEKFLEEIPQPFNEKPRAVLFRHIATGCCPNQILNSGIGNRKAVLLITAPTLPKI